jgi:hypothetical protein
MIFLIINQRSSLSSGAQPVLPMGVAPEAIVEFFSGICLNILSSHLPSCSILCANSSGAHQALPMVVAPEAIRGCLQPFIDSNIFLLYHFFPLKDWKTLLFLVILYVLSMVPRHLGALVILPIYIYAK